MPRLFRSRKPKAPAATPLRADIARIGLHAPLSVEWFELGEALGRTAKRALEEQERVQEMEGTSLFDLDETVVRALIEMDRVNTLLRIYDRLLVDATVPEPGARAPRGADRVDARELERVLFDMRRDAGLLVKCCTDFPEGLAVVELPALVRCARHALEGAASHAAAEATPDALTRATLAVYALYNVVRHAGEMPPERQVAVCEGVAAEGLVPLLVGVAKDLSAELSPDTLITVFETLAALVDLELFDDYRERFFASDAVVDDFVYVFNELIAPIMDAEPDERARLLSLNDLCSWVRVQRRDE